MAQRHGGEWYTHFVFTERSDDEDKGRTMNRRIHEMKIQGKDGWVYTLKGKDLPNFIQVDTGVGTKGKHLAEILLDPRNHPPLPKGAMKRWPSLRDASHLLVGMTFFFLLFRAIRALAELPR